MKKIATFLLLLSGILPAISQRCNLTTPSCNSINASLELKSPAATIKSLVFSLEKEVIPDVWEKINVKSTTSASADFTGLNDGKYRVTCFVDKDAAKQKTNSKIVAYSKTANASDMDGDGYVSNVLSISKCSKEPVKAGTVVGKTAEIAISPIPASNLIRIDNLKQSGFEEETEFVIYDLHGHTLQKGLVSQEIGFTLDVSSLQEGVYFIRLKDGNGHIATKKLLINRSSR